VSVVLVSGAIDLDGVGVVGQGAQVLDVAGEYSAAGFGEGHDDGVDG